MAEHPKGRRIPTDFKHVEKYPFRAVRALYPIPKYGTGIGLGLPYWWRTHVQQGGTCVDFGGRATISITNARQHYLKTGKAQTYRYKPYWLYNEAQAIDEWDDTPPGEGTSVRAACDVLRTKGHIRIRNGVEEALSPAHGIIANRWAQTVDEVRAALWANVAVAIGINWYANFEVPVLYDYEYWIGIDSNGNVKTDLGANLGGHCTCLYRFSDRREAFKQLNSWDGYPQVWIPYEIMERLIGEYGEVAVITDR